MNLIQKHIKIDDKKSNIIHCNPYDKSLSLEGTVKFKTITMMKKNVLIIAVALFFAYQSNAQEQKEIKVGSFDEVKFEGSAQWILVPSEEEKVVIVSKSKDVFDFINV